MQQIIVNKDKPICSETFIPTETGILTSKPLYILTIRITVSHYVWVINKAWSINDLLHGFRAILSCRTEWVVLSGQDSAILPAWTTNQSAEFGSPCPLTELAIQ